jgi:hypothetical protein
MWEAASKRTTIEIKLVSETQSDFCAEIHGVGEWMRFGKRQISSSCPSKTSPGKTK